MNGLVSSPMQRLQLLVATESAVPDHGKGLRAMPQSAVRGRRREHAETRFHESCSVCNKAAMPSQVAQRGTVRPAASATRAAGSVLRSDNSCCTRTARHLHAARHAWAHSSRPCQHVSHVQDVHDRRDLGAGGAITLLEVDGPRATHRVDVFVGTQSACNLGNFSSIHSSKNVEYI